MSAVYKRSALAASQPAVERFIAGLLLVVSLIGSILWGGGGVSSWLADRASIIGAAGAVGLQLVCTWVQWVYACDRWASRWWLAAFGASTIMTVAGYWPLAHGHIEALLRRAQVPEHSVPWVAGGLLIILAGVLDYLPEQILTE